MRSQSQALSVQKTDALVSLKRRKLVLLEVRYHFTLILSKRNFRYELREAKQLEELEEVSLFCKLFLSRFMALKSFHSLFEPVLLLAATADHLVDLGRLVLAVVILVGRFA